MRRIRFALVTLACAAALTSGAAADAAVSQPKSTTDVPTQQTAMQNVSFMTGDWVGAGWNLGSNGVRDYFTQTENVHYQVQGTVLLVEGQGYEVSDPSKVADSALAVLTYNDTTQQYRWEAFSGGNIVQSVPVVGDDTFQWSLQFPHVIIRYTLTFTARTWHEIGETSVDGGQTWSQTFQQDLVRLG